VYVDLNSTAPSTKVEIARTIAPTGADFVEGAILGAVGATGARTHILVGGEKSQTVAETLAQLGLNVTHYSFEIGQASMFKMLRSVFSKGLEALLLELLVAGKRAGIERDLWEEVTDLMIHHPFDQTAANWVQTHAVACERRYHEMLQVADTMREIGIEPLMTAGTLAFFKRSLSLGLGNRFAEKPNSMDDVIDFMEQRLRECNG
jgi:3-hydroxyisobutyrate dehydrogenase-like beta-hydroxyacid dehydrogenase